MSTKKSSFTKIKAEQVVEINGISKTWREWKAQIIKEHDEAPLNKRFKDTVFLAICAESKENLRDILACVHPEIPLADLDLDLIEPLDLRFTVTNGLYNDLSILYGDKLLVFLEAQSTWNPNMPIRLLGYSARVFENYISAKGLNVYSSTLVQLPTPEFFILLVGKGAKWKDIKDELFLRFSFSDHPFMSKNPKNQQNSTKTLDLSAKVLYNGSRKHRLSGLLLQYAQFVEIADSYFEEHGRNKDSIVQVIKTCMERGILADFFGRHQSEVIDMVDRYFKDEAAWRASRLEAEREGFAKGLAEGEAKWRSLERQEAIARTVATAKSSNQPRVDAVKAISMVFGLSSEDAEKTVDALW